VSYIFAFANLGATIELLTGCVAVTVKVAVIERFVKVTTYVPGRSGVIDTVPATKVAEIPEAPAVTVSEMAGVPIVAVPVSKPVDASVATAVELKGFVLATVILVVVVEAPIAPTRLKVELAAVPTGVVAVGVATVMDVAGVPNKAAFAVLEPKIPNVVEANANNAIFALLFNLKLSMLIPIQLG
jgi:hypothetical protein